MKKILVIGAGAIGSLYGGKLAQAGFEVSIFCRSGADEIKKNGIFVESVWGNFLFKPHEIFSDPKKITPKFDFVLVATKVLPEVKVADLIVPALSPSTSIILLQNGIHIESELQKKFPKHHLISALAFVCVSRISPQKILHQDYGRLVIGDFCNENSEKTQELAAAWRQSGVDCALSSNIRLERWKKLIWNAAFNPMSVLCGGVTTQKILQNDATKELAQNVMKEVVMLAKADGCELESDVVQKNIEATQKMTPYKTSMLLDFEAGRAMEVEAILGNTVRFAKSKNIAVPHLASLYALLVCFA